MHSVIRAIRPRTLRHKIVAYFGPFWNPFDLRSTWDFQCAVTYLAIKEAFPCAPGQDWERDCERVENEIENWKERKGHFRLSSRQKVLTLEFEVGRGYFQSSDGIEGQDSWLRNSCFFLLGRPREFIFKNEKASKCKCLTYILWCKYNQLFGRPW